MPIVLKSGSLTLLESSGPVQFCNGIVLPFTYPSGVSVFLQLCSLLNLEAVNSGGEVFVTLLEIRTISTKLAAKRTQARACSRRRLNDPD